MRGSSCFGAHPRLFRAVLSAYLRRTLTADRCESGDDSPRNGVCFGSINRVVFCATTSEVAFTFAAQGT